MFEDLKGKVLDMCSLENANDNDDESSDAVSKKLFENSLDHFLNSPKEEEQISEIPSETNSRKVRPGLLTRKTGRKRQKEKDPISDIPDLLNLDNWEIHEQNLKNYEEKETLETISLPDNEMNTDYQAEISDDDDDEQIPVNSTNITTQMSPTRDHRDKDLWRTDILKFLNSIREKWAPSFISVDLQTFDNTVYDQKNKDTLENQNLPPPEILYPCFSCIASVKYKFQESENNEPETETDTIFSQSISYDSNMAKLLAKVSIIKLFHKKLNWLDYDTISLLKDEFKMIEAQQEKYDNLVKRCNYTYNFTNMQEKFDQMNSRGGKNSEKKIYKIHFDCKVIEKKNGTSMVRCEGFAKRRIPIYPKNSKISATKTFYEKASFEKDFEKKVEEDKIPNFKQLLFHVVTEEFNDKALARKFAFLDLMVQIYERQQRVKQHFKLKEAKNRELFQEEKCARLKKFGSSNQRDRR